MGAKRAAPKQSAAARKAQEAKYTKKANKKAGQVTGRQSKSAMKATFKKGGISGVLKAGAAAKKSNRSYRIKRTSAANRRNLNRAGSGSRNTRATQRPARNSRASRIRRTSLRNRRNLNRAGSGSRNTRATQRPARNNRRARIASTQARFNRARQGRLGRSGRMFRR